MSGRPRELVHRVFQTSKGPLELLAEAIIEDEGRTLHLKDMAVYPQNAPRLDLGIREVMSLLRSHLADEASTWGFQRLRISGTRHSGAKPGKFTDFSITLTGRGSEPWLLSSKH